MLSRKKTQDLNKTAFPKVSPCYLKVALSPSALSQWDRVYSDLAWSVEAAATTPGQMKDVVNWGASSRACHFLKMKTRPTKVQECAHPYRYFVYLQGETSDLLEKLKSKCSVIALPFSHCKAVLGLGKLDALLSVLPHKFCQVILLPISCCKIHPGLHMWIWISRQTKHARRHTFNSQF